MEDDKENPSQYFDFLLPYAMLYGMSYEDFWYDSDPYKFWAFRATYLIKEERLATLEREQTNFQSWLGGLYIQSAIASTLGDSDYMKLIDFDEIDRRASLTEEEKRQEELDKIVQHSISEKQRIMAILNKKN